jgi:hypothetical protein
VEICDPDGPDPAIGSLERQLEDYDEQVTAVENLEEPPALAVPGFERTGGEQ